MGHLQIPTVTLDDLLKFQAAHFPGASVPATALDDRHGGFQPEGTESGGMEEVEDNDLEYYNDGVKRTLTDEQIEIFRHSEIHALLRERERLAEEEEEEEEEAGVANDEEQSQRASHEKFEKSHDSNVNKILPMMS